MMKSVFLCALNNIACNDLSKAITLNSYLIDGFT